MPEVAFPAAPTDADGAGEGSDTADPGEPDPGAVAVVLQAATKQARAHTAADPAIRTRT